MILKEEVVGGNTYWIWQLNDGWFHSPGAEVTVQEVVRAERS